MKFLTQRIKSALGMTSSSFELDYEQLIHLDAEDLAEGGIQQAYADLRAKLQAWIPEPAVLEQAVADDGSRYSVTCAGRRYTISGPDVPAGDAWGRAAWALFDIVNCQLEEQAVRFYAINGGNDLSGLFLDAQQADGARNALPRRLDWPYLPTLEDAWFGQPH